MEDCKIWRIAKFGGLKVLGIVNFEGLKVLGVAKGAFCLKAPFALQ